MTNRNNGRGSYLNGNYHGGPSGRRRTIEGKTVASLRGRSRRRGGPQTRRQRLANARRRRQQEQAQLSLEVLIKAENESSVSVDLSQSVENLEAKPNSGSLFAKWEDQE